MCQALRSASCSRAPMSPGRFFLSYLSSVWRRDLQRREKLLRLVLSLARGRGLRFDRSETPFRQRPPEALRPGALQQPEAFGLKAEGPEAGCNDRRRLDWRLRGRGLAGRGRGEVALPRTSPGAAAPSPEGAALPAQQPNAERLARPASGPISGRTVGCKPSHKSALRRGR